MKLSNLIACICEGAAKEAIIELLLESDKLIFNRQQLLEEQIIRCRKAVYTAPQELRFCYSLHIHYPTKREQNKVRYPVHWGEKGGNAS